MSSNTRKISSVYVCIAYIRQKSKNVGLSRPSEICIREENVFQLKDENNNQEMTVTSSQRHQRHSDNG